MKQIMLEHVVPNVIRWPAEGDIDAIKADFFARGYIHHIVGAVDGTHVPILIPGEEHIDYILTGKASIP